MNILKLIETGTTPLSAVVDADLAGVITALSEVAAKADALIAHGVAVDPAGLIDTVRKGIGSEMLKTLFDAAGEGDFHARLVALADRIGRLPPEAAMLIKPLSAFTETVTGTVAGHDNWVAGADPGRIGWNKAGDLLTPKLAETSRVQGGFTLSGGIAIDCEAGSLWFYARDAIAAEGLLRIGIAGELGATADGTLPFKGLGSLEAQAAAQGAAAAHLFWRKPPATLYAVALAEAIARPVDLLDLADVLAACRDDDLLGFVLTIDGSATLKVEVAIARQFDVAGLFSGSAGLTVSVDLSRKAAYELSALRQTDGGLRVALSHGDGDVDGWGLGLGVDIDAGPMFARVGAAMTEALDHWDDVLEAVKPYLTPGTLLKAKAEAAIDELLQGSSPALEALRTDLRLLTSRGETETSALVDVLRDEILARIDSIGGTATRQADALADAIAQAASHRLPAIADTQLGNDVKTLVEGLIGDFQTSLVDRITALADAERKAVAAALRKLGVKVSDKADAIDERVAGIKTIVERFDALLRKMVDATKDAALAKISARLAFEKSRVEQEEIEFAGYFGAATAESTALYRSLLLGQLSRLEPLLGEPGQVAGFRLDAKASSIRRFSKVSRTLGYELVLLGIDFTGSAKVSGQADVVLRGEEVSVKAIASASRIARGYKQRREACLVESYDLLIAKAEARGPREPALQRGVTLELSSSREDDTIEVREVADFLALLVQMKLIANERSLAMQRHLADQMLSRGTGKLGGRVTLTMALNFGQVMRLIECGRQIDRNGADKANGAAARMIFAVGLDAMLETGEWPADDFLDWQRKHGRNMRKLKTLDEVKAHFFEIRDMAFEQSPGPHPVGNPEGGEEAARRGALNGLVGMIAQMAAIYDAEPRGPGDRDPAHWDAEAYRDAAAKIADRAQRWLLLNQVLIIFFNRGIAPRVVALLLALIRIAEIGEAPNGTFDPLFRLSLALDGAQAKAF